MTTPRSESVYQPARRLPADGGPLVTVFIPTVGRLALIRESVQSAQAQTYGRIEILLGDNGSTDGTERYIAELSAEDERVASYRFTTRVPMSRSWQEGFDRANGRYLIVLSDDDLITADCISSCVEAFLANPSAQVVAGVQETIGTENTPETERWKRHYVAQAGGPGRHAITVDSFNGWRPLMGACLLDTAWWKDIGFGTYSGMSADIDMFLRGSIKGYEAVVIDRTIAKYRIHPTMNSASAVNLHSDAMRVIDQVGRASPGLFTRPAWRHVHDSAVDALVNSLVAARKIAEARACIEAHRETLDPRLRKRLDTKVWLNSSEPGRFLWRKVQDVRAVTRRLRGAASPGQ